MFPAHHDSERVNILSTITDLSFVLVCRGLVAGGAQAATSGVSAGGASNSGSASFQAYTPTSTLAITGASITPHSISGSVAGPLALTPVRRMDLPHQGMPLNVLLLGFLIFCTCSALWCRTCSIVLSVLFQFVACVPLKPVVGMCFVSFLLHVVLALL